MHNNCDLQIIAFPIFDNNEASLTVYEGIKNVPFNMARLFVIKASENCNRGFHAHKECSQLLVVLNGTCKVICDDGQSRKKIILDKASEGLLIPPTIWAEQEYQCDTVLLVLTDKRYDEGDYLRNYNEFIEFRNNT